MRLLITGITGFTGGHLVDFLSAKKGVEVHGISRHATKSRRHVCDILDGERLEKLIRQIRPDRIFHLAAQASVPVSWEHPKETFEQNLIGTLNLLEAARRACPRALIQLAGSSQEYGIPPKKIWRIDESAPLNPMSPYAVSKVSQDLLADFYIRHFRSRIVRTRAFNYIGPRQSDHFVASSFARQIALIEAGRHKPEILVGNLNAVRDYTDVRDMVRAYWLCLEKGKVGEVYNIASGRGCSARRMLEFYLRLSPVKIKIKKDLRRFRSNDLPRLVGNPGKFRRQTGWKPQIKLEDSLTDILNYWRKEVSHG